MLLTGIIGIGCYFIGIGCYLLASSELDATYWHHRNWMLLTGIIGMMHMTPQTLSVAGEMAMMSPDHFFIGIATISRPYIFLREVVTMALDPFSHRDGTFLLSE